MPRKRHNLVDRDGVRVCAEKCPTCIFRPGNLMHLHDGRVKEMVASATMSGVQLLQVAERIGFVKYVPVDNS